MTRIRGGCLCGDIRYEASAVPEDNGYCHCRMCQRASGAPAQCYAGFPIAAFAYVAGEPVVYVSSDIGERRFCARCGSSIEFRERLSPARVYVNAGTLDDPSVAPPAKHIWTASRVPWFALAGGLPASTDGG
jgi:hypothetical protein